MSVRQVELIGELDDEDDGVEPRQLVLDGVFNAIMSEFHGAQLGSPPRRVAEFVWRILGFGSQAWVIGPGREVGLAVPVERVARIIQEDSVD